MESSACRRGASDADQSAAARAYSATVKCEPVMVKVEPEWGECDVSEAAVAEVLYATHEVKEELVIGPELIEQQDIAFSMQNGWCSMEKGPYKPKIEGGADAAPECTTTCRGEGPGCNRSTEQQHGLKNCYVRLERLPVGDLSSVYYMLRIAEEDACKLEPAGEAGPATEGTRAQSDLYTRQHTHTGLKPHSCDICHKQFTSHFILTDHKRIHTGETPYSCDVCNKQFTQKRSLTVHTRRHTDEKLYRCEICCKQLTSGCKLTDHMRTHTGERPFSCGVCGKQFADKTNFIRHTRLHTGERPYGCDICKKRFKLKSTLTGHVETHTGEKPHSCDICKTRFLRKSALIEHVRIHTNEKPYRCHICSKRFKTGRQLTVHMRTHTREKPFRCSVCGKQFADKADLTEHNTRIHTGEKPYSCDI